MNQNILKEDIRYFSDSFDLFDDLKGKSILITGSTGLLGSILVKCLIELDRNKHLGISVYAHARNSAKSKALFSHYPEIHTFTCELFDLPNATIPKIDYLIHLASPTSSKLFVSHPVETFRTIVEGTDAVLRFAQNNQVTTLLYVSSMEVYGVLPKGIVATEDKMGYIDPTKARSSYSMGKRAAETLCFNFFNEYGLDVRIARLAQTFGAGISEEENRVFAQFAKSILFNRDIVLHTSGESSHCYCYTTDAISALLYIILFGKAGVAYNVGNKDTYCSIREMAELVCHSFSTSSSVRIDLDPSAPYPPATFLQLDMSRLEQLGWTPRYSLKEMYERLLCFLCPNCH